MEEIRENPLDNAKYIQTAEEEDNLVATFFRILFISNPRLNSIQVWVDDGQITFVDDTDEFLKKLEKTLEWREYKRIEVATMDHGIPYLYDRITKKLTQLYTMPDGRGFDFTKALDDVGKTEDDGFESLVRDNEFITSFHEFKPSE